MYTELVTLQDEHSDACNCQTLPNGEHICDPVDCDSNLEGVQIEGNSECRCEDLGNGEHLCEPVGCDSPKGRVMEEECSCETLANGEKICDPVDCEYIDDMLTVTSTHNAKN